VALTSPIDGTELRVGDIIIARLEYGSAMFINLKVTSLEYNIEAQHLDGTWTEAFAPDDPDWKFYLVERAKQPLPTHFGAKVVAEGEEYLNVTPGDKYCWISESGDWYTNEQMSEKDWKVA